MKTKALAVSLLLATAALAVRAETVTEWDRRAARASATANQPVEEAARTIAMVRAAIADAIAPANGSNGGNGATGPVPRGTVRSAAAAMAAFAVLEHVFPDQLPDLEVVLAVNLADVPESQEKADALVRGRKAAAEILARMPRRE